MHIKECRSTDCLFKWSDMLQCCGRIDGWYQKCQEMSILTIATLQLKRVAIYLISCNVNCDITSKLVSIITKDWQEKFPGPQ